MARAAGNSASKMVGVVVVTHGNLAAELLRTMEMIVGKQAHMRAVSVSLGEDSRLCEQMKATIAEVDAGKGVLILTDMFGGTPSNLSLSFLEEKKVEVITGVNLPMLVKLADEAQEQDLDKLKRGIVEYGRKNILLASELLSARIK